MMKVDAAVQWARRGFRVFPCLPDEPGKEGNERRAKKPVWEGWTEWATADEATIRSWWGAHEFNIGVLTTDMVVVDIDTKPGKDGMASWMQVYGGFETLMVRTPSGGYHLYYTGANVALNQGALGTGLDIRSHHGYVLAPGSTIEGRPYTVEIDQPLAQAPREVVARCKPPGERAANAQATLVDEDDPRAVSLAVQAIAATPAAIDGERSQRAYELACKVRDYGISEHMCRSLMAAWGAQSNVVGDDLNVRIANAYQYAQNASGAKHPDVLFSGIVIPPIPDLLPTPERAVALQTGAFTFGNATALAALKPRPWVLRRLLLRREITTLIAPGGVGKSLVQLMTAVFLAAGKDMFGFENADGRWWKSIIYNAEDSLDEMSMRLYALCTALNIDANLVIPRIMLISGKTHLKLRLVVGGQQPSINEEAFRLLIDAARDPDVALLGLDPLNKLHTVNGIDNIAMTFVMEQIETLAELTDVAMMVSHHTSKPNLASSANYAGSPDAAQGASAVRDSSRIMMTLMAPSDEDATRFGLTGQERRMYLRMDDAKMNRTLATDETLWLRKVPVRLWNGEEVGGLDRADMHARTEATRQAIARALYVGMTSTTGKGGIALKDAAALLRASEPLFGQMKADVVRQRIQAFLAQPVTLPDGSLVSCVELNGTWMVTLQ
jgi:hypothetical protein